MTDEGFKRKLAAILSADVKGYSRLMDDDEEATVRTIKAYRATINDLAQQYRGRIVDSPGDNILAEFGSVVDAVNCAVEIQRDLAERNAELPDNRRMQFRIGVNLGDVIEDDGNIYGDGVNIAARVESLAEPGGVCISGRAYDQVANKLGLEYENLGEHQVKNISTPIRVYRVLSYPGAAAHRVVQGKATVERKWRKLAIPATVVVVIAVVLGIWQFSMRRPSMEAADPERMAYPLPEKPSIAVLPFDNLSGDPEQEYLADGITENITMALSKIPDMFVIARNSTFTYKGKPTKVKQVAEELGVRYVLEGSVQKSGERLRITAQLIDAIKGHHLWSDRYDRELKDIFALQDEITIKITSALQVKLVKGGEVAAQNVHRGTENLQAYLKLMEAQHHMAGGTPEDYALARKLGEEANALDPEYPQPYSILAWCHILDFILGTSKSRSESLDKAFELAQKLVAMDESGPLSHQILSIVYRRKGEYEKAITEAEKAVALDPNSDKGIMELADSLSRGGRPQEAIPLLKKSMRLSPLSQTHASMCLFRLGDAYNQMGQYEEALSAYKKAIDIRPTFWAIHVSMVICYVNLGREEEARAAAAEVLRISPNLSLKRLAQRKEFKDQVARDRFIDIMHKAGLK